MAAPQDEERDGFRCPPEGRYAMTHAITHAIAPTPDLAAALIAENFSRDEAGVLRVGGLPLTELAEHHGTPLFVYDADLLRRSYRALRAAVAGFAEVDYSVKANPNPAVIRLFHAEGAGAEIASGAEFDAARIAEAERLYAAIDEDDHRDQLLATPEGVELLGPV